MFLLMLACSGGVTTTAEPTGPVRDVTPAQAQALIQDKAELVILDIRTPQEFGAGHIPGAKNIDYRGADFSTAIGSLDPNTPVLVHCASGGRSKSALPVLKQAGLVEIHHLDGGFSAWAAAGMQVEE